jgi:hypothetical protein
MLNLQEVRGPMDPYSRVTGTPRPRRAYLERLAEHVWEFPQDSRSRVRRHRLRAGREHRRQDRLFPRLRRAAYCEHASLHPTQCAAQDTGIYVVAWEPKLLDLAERYEGVLTCGQGRNGGFELHARKDGRRV